MRKENTLRKNWQFQDVIKSKKQIVTKYLVVYFIPNNLENTRIGISISKKFANAVGRNKQRRQTRSIIDSMENSILNNEKHLDLVIILRKPYIDATFDKKVKAFEEISQKL